MSCERTLWTSAMAPITATIAAMARYVSHGNSHMRSFSRSGASASRRRRVRNSATAISREIIVMWRWRRERLRPVS